jgi:hypothetical protein
VADILWVVGALVVLVTALLVVDWFTAGRAKRRLLVRAKDQQVGNANVDYTVIQRIGQGLDNQGGGGI